MHNPGFDESGGKYILMGHSLGGLISFDVRALDCHWGMAIG